MQKGFPLYHLMSGLMPVLRKGTHAFHPYNQTRGASSTVSTMVPELLSDNEATATTSMPIQPSISKSVPTISASTTMQSLAPPSDSHDPPPPSSPPASVASSTHDMPPPSSQQIPHTSGPSTVTSSTTKRKYSAMAASQSGQTSSMASGKKQCSAVPGVVALNSIKESLDTFNKTIECSLVQPSQEHIHDTSPECHAKAMAPLQEVETHLDNAHMIALIDFFKADTAEADTYMSLQCEALHKKWLDKQLSELCGFPVSIDVLMTV